MWYIHRSPHFFFFLYLELLEHSFGNVTLWKEILKVKLFASIVPKGSNTKNCFSMGGVGSRSNAMLYYHLTDLMSFCDHVETQEK